MFTFVLLSSSPYLTEWCLASPSRRSLEHAEAITPTAFGRRMFSGLHMPHARLGLISETVTQVVETSSTRVTVQHRLVCGDD